MEKKLSEKKLNTIMSENSLKKSCICYTKYNETVIKNNICTVCNRYIENINDYSIKKKYQLQEACRPR